MIIRGGENISPAEIEEFLYHHPKIQEAEVLSVLGIGMPPPARIPSVVCRYRHFHCACLRLQTDTIIEM